MKKHSLVTGPAVRRWIRRVIAVACVFSTAVAVADAGAFPAAAEPAASAVVTDPSMYVNPLAGTGSGGSIVGSINEFPGPDVPFGMLQWSPDTASGASASGYFYGDSRIKGFSLTHLSGVGCNAMGDIPFLPTTGPVPSDPQDVTAGFSHSTEQASAGYYAVTLAGSGVRTELTTTLRSGIGRFTYPKTTAANMLIKAGASLAGNDAASIQVAGNNEVVGSATSGHLCGMPNQYTVYFAVVFDHPFTGSGTWNGTTVSAGSTSASAAKPSAAARTRPASGRDTTAGAAAAKVEPKTAAAAQQASGPHVGAYVTFDTTQDPVVQAKVAVSYVSVAGAEANLAAGQPGWDFDGTHAAAVAAWNHQLSKIQVGGGTPGELTTFYTALYHTMLDPDVFSDVNGQYIGYDDKVHQAPPGHAQYANYSGWDIYRSEAPLLGLLAPAQASDMAQSLVNDAAQGGWLPKWAEANDYTGVMNGDAADPIIANLAAYGGTRFDTKAALAAMIKGATDTTSPPGQWGYVERPDLASYLQDGYVPNVHATSISPVPNGASETLEYATADFAISQLAQSLGDTSTYRAFLARSQNWTNLFDTALGYIEPRNATGAFPAPPPVQVSSASFGQSGFQEGNAAQYTWMVPQDLRGLFDAMGGNAAAVRRLDAFFTQLNAGPNAPYMWAGNEPSLATPWEYDYAGAPYKTQATVRQIMTRLYGPTPGGAPGNDDLGAMSAWYVWGALGMYPETPGVPELVLGSPLFPHMAITLPTGRTLTIDAPQASATTPYVQNLSLNGRPWGKTWLPASAIRAGGTLAYTLAASPDPSWGAAPQDAPHSYASGPLHFPPSTAAYLTAQPRRIDVAPGSSAQAGVELDNTAGTAAVQGHWTASTSSGLTVTPASGTIDAGSGASATEPVTITVPSGTQTGYYQVTITGTAQNGALLPPSEFLVVVAPPGTAPPVSVTLGTQDTDNGLSLIQGVADGNTTAGTFDGMSARETAPGAGDPYARYLYFQVAPYIAQNGTFQATFTVTYYDHGNSTWYLQYDSRSAGAYKTVTPGITLTGSDTWKTATITVNDADFAEGENGGADFRLAATAFNPGQTDNLIVHKVSVVPVPN